MLTDEQKAAYDGLYSYAKAQMAAGIPDDVLHQAIVQQGWHPEVASTIISNLHAQHKGRRKRENRQVALRDILLGGAICLVGTVVTIYTYSTASNSGGGKYVIAWGAIVFGGIQLFKGLVGLAAA
jgi:hypothetical protein